MLDLPTAQAVHQVITGTPGQPDQFPYTDSWLLMAQTLPSWARFCRNRQGQSRVFVTQPLRKKKKKQKKKKKIYIPGRSSGRPTTAPTIRSPDSTSPSTASTGPTSRQPSSHVSPIPPHGQDSSRKPVGRQLHSAKQSNQLATTLQMWETQGPQQVNEDGSVQPGRSILYYQPFSTTNPLNWKHPDPVYSDKPQAMIDLLESICTPISWDNCCQLLTSLFTTEERKVTHLNISPKMPEDKPLQRS